MIFEKAHLNDRTGNRIDDIVVLLIISNFKNIIDINRFEIRFEFINNLLNISLRILCKFLCKCPRRVACLRMSTSVSPGERRGKTLISSILASRAVSRARTPRAKNMLTVQAVAGHGKVSLGETSRPPSDGGRRNLKTHRLRSVRSARPSPSELTKSIQTGGLGSNLL